MMNVCRIHLLDKPKEQINILQDNYTNWQNNELTAVKFMEILGLKKNTFYKIIKQYESKANKAS